MGTEARLSDFMRSPLFPIFLLATVFSGVSSAEPWQRHAVESARPIDHLSGADGVRLADCNDDGRLDIVTGWEEGDAIRIYLHPGLEEVKNPWPATTVGAVSSPEDAVFADLDGDGRLDVVSATEGKERTIFAHWAPKREAIADSAAWETAPFPSTRNRQWWMYTLPLDADSDGDTDLVIGSKNAGASLSWLENPGPETARDLSAWTLHRLTEAGWIMSIRLLEHGGDRHLCYSDRKGPGSGVWLLPILDQAPWFGDPVRIGAAGEEVMFLDVANLDDDDRPDIVAAIRPDRLRVLYQPEQPLRPWPDIADFDPLPGETYGTMKAVRVGRIDEDGLPDFALTCERAGGDRVGVLWTNLHSEFTAIGDGSGIKFDRIELLDLDEDGDLDLLTCEERAGLGVVWYENPTR